MDAIYNSRNYYRLLNTVVHYLFIGSTTVEITIGYLTLKDPLVATSIYNSRNYYRLLNVCLKVQIDYIYNSRNYYRLLNPIFVFLHNFLSCNHHI